MNIINSKQGNIWLGITFGLFIFIFGVLVLNFFLDDITQARIDLQCSQPTLITSGTMIVCLMLDGIVPYWIWFFCSMALGFFLGRNT